ncbi:hypothetical protein TGMAS_415940 [Toxoplasma gondii MAS]|uniref:Uncharacterized protein n=1 Tax=Toxoplasma gondii MAS TaxID=943118 RepID=A0A086Q2S4_TOXGO|nr:hypothetical protein TGMAS_415940 [Toxoplasma gondii MAS]
MRGLTERRNSSCSPAPGRSHRRRGSRHEKCREGQEGTRAVKSRRHDTERDACIDTPRRWERQKNSKDPSTPGPICCRLRPWRKETLEVRGGKTALGETPLGHKWGQPCGRDTVDAMSKKSRKKKNESKCPGGWRKDRQANELAQERDKHDPRVQALHPSCTGKSGVSPSGKLVKRCKTE